MVRVLFDDGLKRQGRLNGCGRERRGMQPAILFNSRVIDVPAIDAAPAFQPPVAAAFLKIQKVIPRHTALTSSTSHKPLLCYKYAFTVPGRGRPVETQRGYLKRGRWERL